MTDKTRKIFEGIASNGIGYRFIADTKGISGSACSSLVREGYLDVVGATPRMITYNDGSIHIKDVNVYEVKRTI